MVFIQIFTFCISLLRKKLEKLTKVLEKKLILKTENVPSKLAIFTRLKNKLEALVFLVMKGSENMQSMC